MKNTILYLVKMICFSVILHATAWSQSQVGSSPGQAGVGVSGSGGNAINQMDAAIAAKQDEIKNLSEQLALLQNELKAAEDNKDKDAIELKIQDVEKKLQQAKRELESMQNELQAAQPGQIPPAKSSLGPVSGNSVVFFNNNSKARDQYQLIPVKNATDARNIKSYLDEILQDGFNISLQSNPENTTWIFVSSVDENIVYNRPYLKEDKVWFDTSPKRRGERAHLSLWVFQLPQGQNFRVRFNGLGKSAEMSSATLLGTRFIKGVKKEEIAGAFKIVSSGEYFEDTIQFISNEGTAEQKNFGSLSYLNTIPAQLGSMFGIEYIYLGKMKRSYNFKFIHPPFKTGPERGATEFAVSKLCVNNKKDNFIWKFTEDYELIPGSWQLQILDGGVVIYKKSFMVNVQKSQNSMSSGARVPASGLPLEPEPSGTGLPADTP